MKKSGKLFVIISLVVCVAFLVAPAAVQAGKGAVKMDLCEDSAVVGWAIANTTASGDLIVQVHLDNGAPDGTFDVYVKVNSWGKGEIGQEGWHQEDVGKLATNGQGKGNAHVVLDLADYLDPDYAADTIEVQVVVKNAADRYATPDSTEVLVPVPLK